MVFMRRRALLLMGLLIRLRRARGGLRQHVGCGASMRGAVHSYSAWCSKRSHGKASEPAEAQDYVAPPARARILHGEGILRSRCGPRGPLPYPGTLLTLARRPLPKS